MLIWDILGTHCAATGLPLTAGSEACRMWQVLMKQMTQVEQHWQTSVEKDSNWIP